MNFDLQQAVTAINPSINRIQWPSRLKAAHEFHLTANLDGLIGEGHGVSYEDEELSKQIALVEAMERIVARKNDLLNTSGIAGHYDKKTAQFNAVREYFKRFTFLMQFYSGHVGGEPLNLSAQVEEYQKAYSHLNFSNRLIAKGRHNGETLNVVLSLCRIYQSYFIDGMIIGLGCHPIWEVAKEKAEIETMRKTNYFLERIDSEMDMLTFSNLSEPTLDDHGRLSLSPSYFYQVEKVLFSGESTTKIREFNLNIETVKLEAPETIEKIGLHFYRAFSKEGVDVFTGKPNGDHISDIQKAASRFSLPIDKRLIEFPHPIA